MSRNKVILLICVIVLLYLFLPTTGSLGLFRAYMIAILPYVLVLIIVWLLVTINLLKKAMYRLSGEITERNTLSVAKLLGMTFDVKRFIGEQNIIELYKRVNFSSSISLSTKNLMYENMKKKHINGPPPSQGKKRANSK